MANAVYLHGRNGVLESYTDNDLQRIAEAITPDNAPGETQITRTQNRFLCLINPTSAIPVRETNVCLGQLFPPDDTWYHPGADQPDGSYAIIRNTSNCTELVSDDTASRTLFYRLYDDLFVASTSQRAIMHFADDVSPDERAMAWLISSGMLGPRQTWDSRLEAVPPRTTVRFDASTWTLDTTTHPVTFDPANRTCTDHKFELGDAIDDTFDAFQPDYSDWVLPLSGGLDSREILLQLQDEPNLQTITWATEATRDETTNDAYLARELADACGVDHEFLDLPEQPLDDLEKLFDRFLTAGEGRVDKISGYADGFAVFESLAKQGTAGIIRGDEGFGWHSVGAAKEARLTVEGTMISDYERLSSFPIPGKGKQQWPEQYQQRPGETPAMWRDRLYHTYRLPVMMAALSALKAPYVEVVNPFLSRRILRTVRTLPDAARTNKALYTELVMDRSPDVAIAEESASPDMGGLLKTPRVVDYLREHLDTPTARSSLGEELVGTVRDELTASASGSSRTGGGSVTNAVKRTVGRHLPETARNLITATTPVSRPEQTLSMNLLAFRLYIISEMLSRIGSDTERL